MVAPKLRFKDENGQEFGEWKETSVEHICNFTNGKAHENDITEHGDYIVVNSKFVSSEGRVFKKTNSRHSLIKKDSVVMVMSDVPNGKTLAKCFYISENNKFTLNQRVCSLKSKQDNKFIFYSLNRNKFYLSFDSGTGQTNLKKQDVLDCPIHLPTLPEQTKIANFLSAVDERIQQVSQTHELLTQYKKGVLQKIFSQELRFKDENGEEFGEWGIRRIKEILTIGSGRDYKHLNNGNVPVYGTGGLMTTVDSFIYEGETVCIGRKGTIDKPFFYSGKIWTVDTLFYTHKFIDALPRFVYQLFLTINWKEHNEASGVPSLSKSTIESIIVNMPTLPEQTKIANFLSAIDDKIKQAQSQLTALQEYKRGLLQQMFV